MKRIDLYFASCAKDGGIYHYVWNDELPVFADKVDLDRPMYMVRDGNKLHVLLLAPFAGKAESGLVTLTIGPDGTLGGPQAPAVSTRGVEACHLCCAFGSIYAANYGTGSLFSTTGKLDIHEGCGVNTARQEGPHTHCIIPAPDGEHLVSTDLGLDRIFVCDRDLAVIGTAAVPDGQGPRHLVFSPGGDTLYCVNELGSSVSRFSYAQGNLTYIDTTPALFRQSPGNTAAAIRLKDGRIYVSHRGEDAISCMRGDTMELLCVSPCGGVSPRDFIITGDTVFSANEGSNEVSLLKIEGTGLKDTGFRIPMEHPLCALAAER